MFIKTHFIEKIPPYGLDKQKGVIGNTRFIKNSNSKSNTTFCKSGNRARNMFCVSSPIARL